MPKTCARELRTLANAGLPNEVCGFVMEDWSVWPVPNSSKQPRNSFEFESEELLRILRDRSFSIRGVYHSHPGGTPHPSDYDAEHWCYSSFRYWVVTAFDVYEWEITNGKVSAVTPSGARGPSGLAYPVLEVAETVRR
jgi:desampylase